MAGITQDLIFYIINQRRSWNAIFPNANNTGLQLRIIYSAKMIMILKREDKWTIPGEKKIMYFLILCV